MQVTVRLFGPSADSVGAPSVDLDVPADATCAEVREALGTKYEALRRYLAVGRLAVNHAFASDTQTVCAADEIALIAMVGGG
jgi:molybdopterin converting factor small subunit